MYKDASIINYVKDKSFIHCKKWNELIIHEYGGKDDDEDPLAKPPHYVYRAGCRSEADLRQRH